MGNGDVNCGGVNSDNDVVAVSNIEDNTRRLEGEVAFLWGRIVKIGIGRDERNDLVCCRDKLRQILTLEPSLAAERVLLLEWIAEQNCLSTVDVSMQDGDSDSDCAWSTKRVEKDLVWQWTDFVDDEVVRKFAEVFRTVNI